jgi:filamentous hemagglutinin
VYEVVDAAKALHGEFDRLYGDGELTEAEAQELQEAAVAVGINIVFEVTAGKVVKGMKIASIAGDFSVSVAKKLGLDKVLADLNRKFDSIGNATNRTLPSGYTRNADGSIRGPNGGTAYETGHVDAAGNTVFRREGGGYYTIGTDGRQVTASSPYTSGAPPVHHVCTNKNCVSTANGGPWTPRFQEFFDNAGLNINSEINKIAVPGHRGPHPAAYHQYVFGRLERGTQGLTPNTPAYQNAVTNVLNDIKVEAVTPGNQVNSWLTGG